MSSMSVSLTEGNVEICLSRLHATRNAEDRDKVAKLVHNSFYRGHNVDLLFHSLARMPASGASSSPAS